MGVVVALGFSRASSLLQGVVGMVLEELAWATSMFHKQEGPNVMLDYASTGGPGAIGMDAGVA